MYLYNLSKILKPYHVPESAKGLFKAQITTIPTVSATLGCGLELTFLTSFLPGEDDGDTLLETTLQKPLFRETCLKIQSTP